MQPCGDLECDHCEKEDKGGDVGDDVSDDGDNGDDDVGGDDGDDDNDDCCSKKAPTVKAPHVPICGGDHDNYDDHDNHGVDDDYDDLTCHSTVKAPPLVANRFVRRQTKANDLPISCLATFTRRLFLYQKTKPNPALRNTQCPSILVRKVLFCTIFENFLSIQSCKMYSHL